MTKKICGAKKTLIILIVFSAVAAFSGPEEVICREIDDCIECHMDRNLTKTDASGKVHNLYVDKEKFIRSVHGEMEYACVDCHEGAEADSHPADGIPDVNCGNADCHAEASRNFEKTRHGKLLKEGNPDVPQCWDCHSMHAVFYEDDPQSSTNPENIALTCGKCHKEEARAPLLSLIVTRVKGHGKVDPSCSFSTRRCTDCHFQVRKSENDDQQSKVCVNCHGTERNRALFGTIHKSGVFKSPFLSVVMGLCYIVAIAAMVFYFMAGGGRKKSVKKSKTVN